MSRARDLDHGADASMHRLEQQVMARWDAGASVQKIIAEMSVAPKTIRKIVSLYGNSEAQARTFDTMVRAGSAALAAAIAATGRRYS